MSAFLLSAFALLIATPSYAADVGVPVTIRIADVDGNAIPTAVVRHPVEQDRHRVHTVTGEWTGSVLYMPNGDELVFAKNMILEFEISAPGFTNAQIKYQVRKRKNLIEVTLDKDDFTIADVDDSDEVHVIFKRDVPLDKAPPSLCDRITASISRSEAAEWSEGMPPGTVFPQLESCLAPPWVVQRRGDTLVAKRDGWQVSVQTGESGSVVVLSSR